jgi:hypothetical protein
VIWRTRPNPMTLKGKLVVQDDIEEGAVHVSSTVESMFKCTVRRGGCGEPMLTARLSYL